MLCEGDCLRAVLTKPPLCKGKPNASPSSLPRHGGFPQISFDLLSRVCYNGIDYTAFPQKRKEGIPHDAYIPKNHGGADGACLIPFPAAPRRRRNGCGCRRSCRNRCIRPGVRRTCSRTCRRGGGAGLPEYARRLRQYHKPHGNPARRGGNAHPLREPRLRRGGADGVCRHRVAGKRRAHRRRQPRQRPPQPRKALEPDAGGSRCGRNAHRRGQRRLLQPLHRRADGRAGGGRTAAVHLGRARCRRL